jgi:hypothetical protein
MHQRGKSNEGWRTDIHAKTKQAGPVTAKLPATRDLVVLASPNIRRAVRPAAACALPNLLLDSADDHGVARQILPVNQPECHKTCRACGGTRLLTPLRSVLPGLTKRYKVPLEAIADGNGERLRNAGGGIGALLK